MDAISFWKKLITDGFHKARIKVICFFFAKATDGDMHFKLIKFVWKEMEQYDKVQRKQLTRKRRRKKQPTIKRLK